MRDLHICPIIKFILVKPKSVWDNPVDLYSSVECFRILNASLDIFKKHFLHKFTKLFVVSTFDARIMPHVNREQAWMI